MWADLPFSGALCARNRPDLPASRAGSTEAQTRQPIWIVWSTVESCPSSGNPARGSMKAIRGCEFIGTTIQDCLSGESRNPVPHANIHKNHWIDELDPGLRRGDDQRKSPWDDQRKSPWDDRRKSLWGERRKSRWCGRRKSLWDERLGCAEVNLSRALARHCTLAQPTFAPAFYAGAR